jgi:TM2 domain-containing membrane protein YozV
MSTLVKKEEQTEKITNFNLDLTAPTESKKSVFLAVVASLIVPGAGELYAGSFETGKYHLIAEGGLWLTYYGFRLHSNWLGQDARTFANQHAGANFDNKDDQYLVNIGNFNNTGEYNETKMRNRESDFVYLTEQYNWQWDISS